MADEFGYSLGQHLIINSGCMSSSNGPNKGWSKACGFSYAWITCKIPPVKTLNWGGAWTSLSLEYFTLERLPLVMHLAQAADQKFWVSFQKFSALIGDNVKISSVASMKRRSGKHSCRP